jgi:hypothetical protein
LQRSRDIDLQDLMSKVKPAKLPNSMVTSATRKAQESQDADLLQHVLGMISKVSHDWKVWKVLKLAQKQSLYSIDLVTHTMRIMPKLRGDAMVSEAMDLMARRLSEIVAKTGHAPRPESAATGKGPVAVDTKVPWTEQNSNAVPVTKTVGISKNYLSPQADSNSMDEPVAATEDALNNPCVSKATIYSKEDTVAEANVASKTIFSEKSITEATKEPSRPKTTTVVPPMSASIAPKHLSVTETAVLINRSSNKRFLQDKQAVPAKKDESTNQAVDDDTAVPERRPLNTVTNQKPRAKMTEPSKLPSKPPAIAKFTTPKIRIKTVPRAVQSAQKDSGPVSQGNKMSELSQLVKKLHKRLLSEQDERAYIEDQPAAKRRQTIKSIIEEAQSKGNKKKTPKDAEKESSVAASKKGKGRDEGQGVNTLRDKDIKPKRRPKRVAIDSDDDEVENDAAHSKNPSIAKSTGGEYNGPAVDMDKAARQALKNYSLEASNIIIGSRRRGGGSRPRTQGGKRKRFDDDDSLVPENKVDRKAAPLRVRKFSPDMSNTELTAIQIRKDAPTASHMDSVGLAPTSGFFPPEILARFTKPLPVDYDPESGDEL